MNFVRRSLVVAASCLVAAPLLLAQQPANQGPEGSPQQNRPHPQQRMSGHQSTEMQDQREERQDEMQDLDQLGLPMGEFWHNPRLAQLIHLSPDQVHRLSDSNLQGRLKMIQLEASLETEQAKLDALFDTDTLDAGAALAQTDRVADARAAIEKADAHMAFDLRAILTPDQITQLRNAPMPGRRNGGPGGMNGGPGMHKQRPGGPTPTTPEPPPPAK